MSTLHTLTTAGAGGVDLVAYTSGNRMNTIAHVVPLVLGVDGVGCRDDATDPSRLELAVMARRFESLGQYRWIDR